MVPLKLEKVGINPESGAAVVVLKDEKGQRLLLIEIGPLEGSAIAYAVEQVSPPRPMTHDLFKLVLDRLETKVTQILIDDLREVHEGAGTFFAQITLKIGDRTVEVDSRPSDAIALAVRSEAPIYALERVLQLAGIPLAADGDGAEEEAPSG